MPQPAAYARGFDFTALAPANIPSAGVRANGEFDALALSMSGVRSNLARIQRDDGALANGVVTLDAMSTATRALVGGWTPRGFWAAATAYAVKDFVVGPDGVPYVCSLAHTSSASFATDALTKWTGVLGSASAIAAATMIQATGSTTARSVGDWLADEANVLAFGATNGGTGNNAAAFQGAIDTGKDIVVPAGNYRFTNGVFLRTSRQRLRCLGPVTFTIVGNVNLFSITGGVQGVELGGFIVDGVAGHTGGRVVYVSDADRVRVHNVLAMRPWLFAYTQRTNLCTFDNIWVYGAKGTGGDPYIWHLYGDPTLRSDAIIFNNCWGSTAVTRGTPAHAAAAGGLLWEGNVHTVDTNGLRFILPSRGVVIREAGGGSFPNEQPSFGCMENLQVDYPYYEGLNADAVWDLKLANPYLANSAAGQNMVIGAKSDMGSVSGGIIVSADSQNLVVGGKDWQFSGVHFIGGSWHHQGKFPNVHCAATAKRISFAGCHAGRHDGIGATASYALQVDAGAAHVSWVGGYMDGVLGNWNNGTTGAANVHVVGVSNSTMSLINDMTMGTAAGKGALFTPTISGTTIASVAVAFGGAHYNVAPTMHAFDPAFTGSGFAATATVSNGVVVSVSVTNPGTGYSADTIVYAIAQNTEPTLRASGASANASMAIRAKGNGYILLGNDYGTGLVMTVPSGAVSNLSMSASVSGGAPTLFASGVDANIRLALTAKGNSDVVLANNQGVSLLAAAPASAVNYVRVSAAAAGGRASMTSGSSIDSNPDMLVDAQGTGGVMIGSSASKKLGFLGTTPISKPGLSGNWTVNPSQVGKDLATILDQLGLIMDGSTV